jgi:hypothetical protein
MPARISAARARKQRAAAQLDAAIRAAFAAHAGLVAAWENGMTNAVDASHLLALVDQALDDAVDTVNDVLAVEVPA